MGERPGIELERQKEAVELLAKENIPYNIAIRKVKGIPVNKQTYVRAQYSSIVQKEVKSRNVNNKSQVNVSFDNHEHQRRSSPMEEGNDNSSTKQY